jgi:CubicO group peptidase (beta-lactamase class C family)
LPRTMGRVLSGWCEFPNLASSADRSPPRHCTGIIAMPGFSQSRRLAIARMSAAVSLPLLGWSSEAQAGTPLENAFDRLVRAEGYKDDAPGLAVMVQQPGQPAFIRCAGAATLKEPRPVTSKTMFELASVSKPITATAILTLHDQRKLAISDDVRKVLPELPEYDRKHPIRIRDLLLQISGLASYMDIANVPAKNKGYWVNEDYVGEFARQNIPQSFPTGEKFEYNNTNYVLLAVIIARVSGKSYGTYLREAIFDPAGMQTAFVSEGPGSVPAVDGRVDAIGYSMQDGQWQERWGLPPARQEKLLTAGDGSIWCSAEDMAAWDLALNNGKLLRPPTAKMAITPSRTRDGKTNDYGCGWSLDYENPERVRGFWHSGGWGGFGTYYYHDLQTRRTIVLLGNGRPLNSDKVWYALTEIVEKHGSK